MDEAALSRASSPTAGLRADFGYTFPTDGRALPPARRLNVRGVAGTMADREGMARSLEPFLTPAPSRQVEEWLAELSVITKRRQDDEFTETLRIRAYSSRLAEFPADVVKDALLRHPWTFFPAWAEVEDVCKRLVAPRLAMIWHLQNAPEETAERRDLPSPERRAEIVRETREIIARMTERASR